MTKEALITQAEALMVPDSELRTFHDLVEEVSRWHRFTEGVIAFLAKVETPCETCHPVDYLTNKDHEIIKEGEEVNALINRPFPEGLPYSHVDTLQIERLTYVVPQRIQALRTAFNQPDVTLLTLSEHVNAWASLLQEVNDVITDITREEFEDDELENSSERHQVKGFLSLTEKHLSKSLKLMEAATSKLVTIGSGGDQGVKNVHQGVRDYAYD